MLADRYILVHVVSTVDIEVLIVHMGVENDGCQPHIRGVDRF